MLYPYPYPHTGILQSVGYRIYTPVFTLFYGCIPYTKAEYSYGYDMLYPCPGCCGTGVQNLQMFRVRV